MSVVENNLAKYERFYHIKAHKKSCLKLFLLFTAFCHSICNLTNTRKVQFVIVKINQKAVFLFTGFE